MRHTLVTSQSLATHPTGSHVSTESMQQYASLCKEPATHFPKFEKLCRTARLRLHAASEPPKDVSEKKGLSSVGFSASLW